MRVILNRALFLGGNRYRRDRYGTDVPDEIPGVDANGKPKVRKIILFDPVQKNNDDVIMLPHDARPYEGNPDERHSNDLIAEAVSTRPTPLSALTPQVAGQANVDSRNLPHPSLPTPPAQLKSPTSKEPIHGRAPNLPEDKSEVAQESTGARKTDLETKGPFKR